MTTEFLSYHSWHTDWLQLQVDLSFTSVGTDQAFFVGISAV